VQQNAALMQAVIPYTFWAELRRTGLLLESAPTPEK
jgi:hypothetical protein